jgi:hypothetical protein
MIQHREKQLKGWTKMVKKNNNNDTVKDSYYYISKEPFSLGYYINHNHWIGYSYNTVYGINNTLSQSDHVKRDPHCCKSEIDGYKSLKQVANSRKFTRAVSDTFTHLLLAAVKTSKAFLSNLLKHIERFLTKTMKMALNLVSSKYISSSFGDSFSVSNYILKK